MYLLIGISVWLLSLVATALLMERVSFVLVCLIAIAGALALAGAAVLTVFRKYFHRPTATLAFVRTGMGPAKVVSSVGSFAVPILHRIIPVTLEPVALSIDVRGEEALIAQDGVPVNMAAEMSVRVQADPDAILLAARSFGERSLDESFARDLLLELFLDALRTVAATKTAADICGDSQTFATAVQDAMAERVEEDGLTLERLEVHPY